ncbi:MAG: dihydropteroate synthase [Negativicutes bacterium]|nr:dihydropteroate synthase [Negativicutes bacterium]
MNFNPRVIPIHNEADSRAELEKIGCDPAGLAIMTKKALFTVVKLEQVPAKAANLLKQTFLAKGGEVAVARGTADLTIEKTDVLISATAKQYGLALTQLKMQPWGLPKVAAAIDSALCGATIFPHREYRWPQHRLVIRPGRTLVMGILNLTPDSFSDGGKYNRLDAALRQAEKLIEEGADILDIGAESTRPYGAEKISADIELERLMPALEKILAFSSVPVSVDTYKAAVAEEAVKCGVHMINDIWGLQHDPDMAKVAAAYSVPVIVTHNQHGAEYSGDIMGHITAFLRRSVQLATTAGLDEQKVIIDPGIGFGKTPAQNLQVLSRLAELKSLGCPILLASSRKKFISDVLGGLPAEEREEGTAASVACGIISGANIVRVHDVKTMVRVSRMTDAIKGGQFDE